MFYFLRTGHKLTEPLLLFIPYPRHTVGPLSERGEFHQADKEKKVTLIRMSATQIIIPVWLISYAAPARGQKIYLRIFQTTQLQEYLLNVGPRSAVQRKTCTTEFLIRRRYAQVNIIKAINISSTVICFLPQWFIRVPLHC